MSRRTSRRTQPDAAPTGAGTARGTARHEGARRGSALPWLSVAAGGTAVAVTVGLAGVVGAATVTSESVVVPEGSTDDWAAELELGPSDVVSGDVPSDGAHSAEPSVPSPGAGDLPSPPGPAPSSTPADPSPETSPDPSPSDAATGTGDAPTDDETAADDGTGAHPDPSTPEEPGPPVLTEPLLPGSDDPAVLWVQERLRVHGAQVEASGVLDPATVRALRAFQRAHALEPDGRVTSATVDALAAAPVSGEESVEEPPGDGDDGSAEPGDGTTTGNPSSGSSTEPSPGASPSPSPTSGSPSTDDESEIEDVAE